jgi:hypothetical protein
MQLGIRWTDRSSPAVAALVITGCWTLALAFGAFVASLLGFSAVADRIADLAKVVAGVTLAFGVLALFVSLHVGRDRRIRRSALPASRIAR